MIGIGQGQGQGQEGTRMMNVPDWLILDHPNLDLEDNLEAEGQVTER